MHKQDNRTLYKRHNDERRCKYYKPTNMTKQNQLKMLRDPNKI